MSFVFSSCSYAVGYGLPKEEAEALAASYQESGVRFIDIVTLDGLRADLGRVRYLVGIHVAPGRLDEIQHLLGERAEWVYVSDGQGAQQATRKALLNLVPPGLGALGIYALKRVMPSLFPGLNLTFTENVSLNPMDFDYVVQCDTSALPNVGRCLLLVNTERLLTQDTQGSLSMLSRKVLLDALRELVNETLGIVNHSLCDHGYACRIGLPSVFQKEDAQALFHNGLYMPFVYLRDTTDIFEMRLGFANSEGGQKLDLTNVKFIDREGEVEFL
jgi:hypothetical protein